MKTVRHTGAGPAVHIAPAVADHPALREVEMKGGGGIVQHARLGLAAASLGVGPALAGRDAGLDARDGRQQFLQVGVHRRDHGEAQGAAPDIGLVGGDDQHIAGRVEPGTRCDGIRVEREFLQRDRRAGFALAHDGQVQGAIAVEKNCTPRSHRTPTLCFPISSDSP
jgi:hypothetical protein